MEQVIYDYLEIYDLDIFKNISLEKINISSLNTCQVNIICQAFAKLLIKNNQISFGRQTIQQLLNFTHINDEEGWGLIVIILLGQSSKSKMYRYLHSNKKHHQRIKYLILEQISLFEEALIDDLVKSIQVSLDKFLLLNQATPTVNLYTIQSLMSVLDKQFGQNLCFERQTFILSHLTAIFKTNPKNVCKLFISSITNHFILDIMYYFRVWFKRQMSTESKFEMIELLELICKGIHIWEKQKNVRMFKPHQIEEIPFLYHFFIKFVYLNESNQYPAFEKFMFKHSQINKIIYMLSSSTIKDVAEYSKNNIALPSLNKIPTFINNPQLVSEFLIYPCILWKKFLKEYIKLSGIKFKKQTLDPLIFLMIKQQLWEDINHSEILQMSLWLCTVEWREKLPKDHPRKNEYLECMRKVMREFLRSKPSCTMITKIK